MKLGGLAACLFVLAAACQPVDAQVIARQATPAEDPRQYFDSPMVLELPLPDLRETARSHNLSAGTEIRNFVCDAVTLHHLVIVRGKTRGKGAKAQVPLELTGVVTVGSSRDKEVLVNYSFMKEETAIATFATKRTEVEEERSKAFRVKLRMSEAKLRTLYEGDPEPVLKIMVTVWDE